MLLQNIKVKYYIPRKAKKLLQFQWEHGGSFVQVLLLDVAFTCSVTVDVLVLLFMFLYCLRMMQHCCRLPLKEVRAYVCVCVCVMGRKDGPTRLRAAANPAHWRFILSFHLSASRMGDGTQVHSRGWLMTRKRGGGGAFHMWLACPWKLMVGGAFALDM